MLKIFSLTLLFLLSFPWAKMLASPKIVNYNALNLESKIKASLLNEPYALSEIESYHMGKAEFQRMKYLVAGLHKKSCSYALVKISQYERYKEFVGFIKKSDYDPQTKRLGFLLSHTLMPFDMFLNFKLERFTGPGLYLFDFDQGFLKGLKGEVHISEYKQRCLFVWKADWQGPYSGIPDGIFSFFSRALGKLAMEKLFRISQTL